MRRLPSSLGVVPVLLLSGVTALVAQDRSCDLIDSHQVNSVTQTGGRVSHVARPQFLCTDGTRIEADSSVTFEANSFTQLFGSVLFRDGPQELLAERAQYFSRAGRLQAQGAVSLTNLEDGSSITGENLVMLQAGDERPEDDMTMRGDRPHARFLSKAVPVSDSLPADEAEAGGIEMEFPLPDSTGVVADTVVVQPDTSAVEDVPADILEAEVAEPEPPAPPTAFDVDADLIRLVGDRLFQARGRVEIRQDSLLAYGDSMEYLQDIGVLTLFQDARVLSPNEESGDTLDVRGDTIDMRLPNNRIDELEARGHAQLVTESVDMRGPVVRILFSREELDRIVSVMGEASEVVDEAPTSVEEAGDSLEVVLPDPFARPQATAEAFLLTGDSIEVKTPGGELESVFAYGQAHGVSSGRDSLNAADAPELIRNDWIEGETITACFVENVTDSTVPRAGPAPEENRYRLDLLVAQGGARSFYRSAPDSTPAPGADPSPLELNYVIGDEIRLFMGDGEVDRMEVDNATGAYFQPQPGSGASVGDTLTPPPPDTSSAPRGPGNPRQESSTNERLQSRPRNR